MAMIHREMLARTTISCRFDRHKYLGDWLPGLTAEFHNPRAKCGNIQSCSIIRHGTGDAVDFIEDVICLLRARSLLLSHGMPGLTFSPKDDLQQVNE